jgi:hypothetical protein
MKRIIIILTMGLFAIFASAQDRSEDSTGLKDIVQSFLGMNQPKLGFMAQFAGEVSDNGHYTTSAFTIRNLRMYFTGSVGEHFKYFFQGSLNQSFEMLDLKLSYIFDEHLRIDGGRFKTPFGVEYLVNDAKLLFVKRSTVASTIGTFRKYGVQTQSSLLDKRVTLTAGAFNGENSYPKKVSLFIGKVHTIPIKFGEVMPDFQFEAGGSIVYTSKYADLPSFIFYKNSHILLSSDAKLIYDKYWLEGEYFAATSNRTKTIDGFYFDAGGKIISELEVIARFDWSAKYLKLAYENYTWQWIYTKDISRKYLIGVNYFPLNHVKLQLDYERDYTLKINSAWVNCQYAINFE